MTSRKINSNFIPLYKDIMFKKFYGTNEHKRFTEVLLRGFLKLPKGSIKDLKIKNSVKLTKNVIENKLFEVDVLVETLLKTYILEMQQEYNTNAEIKNTMYAAKVYSSQLKKGENYNDTKPITLINFVRHLYLHNTGEVVNEYGIINKKHYEDRMLKEDLTFYIVDIEKSKELSYNECSEFEAMLKLIGADTYEEALKVVEEANMPIINELFKEMMEFMSREYVQNYDEQERLIRSNIESAKTEGLAEGLTQGKHASRLEIAKNLFKNDIPLNIIVSSTGLSFEEVTKLKNEIN